MLRKYKWILMSIAFAWVLFGKTDVEAATRIHYIGLHESTDAILLESDGHFGLVDSGEDWDYPDGTDPLYTYRKGIATAVGFEQQVIYYMKSVGVTSKNLDFYIGTHAHSDHIGSGDEIVTYFKPKTLYLKKYSDSNITNKNRLWDNLYVYNNLLSAAKKVGTKCVQNLSEGMQIKLGSSMTLTLYNTKVQKNINDENENSIIIKVNAYSQRTLLTADMESSTARTLIAQGKIGKTDILKVPHHGYVANNPSDILRVFAPKTAIVTGSIGNFSASTLNTFNSMGTTIRSTVGDAAAVVTKFSYAGTSVEMKKIAKGWLYYNKSWSYHDENGRVTTGWKLIDNCWYWFDKTGKMKTGWLTSNGRRYYLAPKGTKGYKEGQMVSGWNVIGSQTYYFKAGSGEMLTGWRTINNKNYYFKKTGTTGVKGRMLTGFKKIGNNIYYFKKTGAVKTKGQVLTGWLTYNGKQFYAAKSGRLGSKGRVLTGWLKVNNKYYYLKTTGGVGTKGQVLTGWQTVNKQSYYFKKSGSAGTKGRMLTGWQTLGGENFYFKKSGSVGTKGRMLTGWRTLNNKKYYFKKTGDTGQKGKALTGWRQLAGKGYYFQKTGSTGTKGKMLTGWTTVDGYQYYLSASGTLMDVQLNIADSQKKWSGFKYNYQYNTAKPGEKNIGFLALQLKNASAADDISYQTYSDDEGWETTRKNGAASGNGNAIKAIKITLSGTLSKTADIYYRVYLVDYGWLDWAKNGTSAGTEKYNYNIGAIQIQLRNKTSSPTITGSAFLDEEADTSDKQELLELVDQVYKLNSQDYTSESWAEVEKALTQAEEVLGKIITKDDQEVVNEAVEQLETAVEQLQKAAAEEADDGNVTDSGIPEDEPGETQSPTETPDEPTATPVPEVTTDADPEGDEDSSKDLTKETDIPQEQDVLYVTP